MRHETQNLVPLGNVIIGNDVKDKTSWRNPANWFMATISDDTGIRLIAIMTSPYNMTLYAPNNGLQETSFIIPGVMSENSVAENFARLYTNNIGIGYAINKRQRIYELLEVSDGIARH